MATCEREKGISGTSAGPNRGFCINCDNRHGCKSKQPPCLVEMDREGVTKESGKAYLIRTHGTERCEECAFFRSCWGTEEYNRRPK